MKALYYITFITFALFSGCKKNEENPAISNVVSNSLPSSLLPLTPGAHYSFSGYLTEGSTEKKIANSENGFYSSWTLDKNIVMSSLLPVSAVQHLSRTSAFLIIDSVSVQNFIPNPKVTPVFVFKDDITGDYFYLTNFGYVFRKYLVYEDSSTSIRKDSLRFIRLASPKAGLSTSFEAAQESFEAYGIIQSSSITITVHITGEFEKKEEMSLNLNGRDTTVAAYYLVIKNTPRIGSITDAPSVTAKFWLVDGLGPVQMFLAGDDEAPGSFRKLEYYTK